MRGYDLVVHGGRLTSATETVRAGIGTCDGWSAAIAERIAGGVYRFDAEGHLAPPGAIKAQCRAARASSAGAMSTADDLCGKLAALHDENAAIAAFAARRAVASPGRGARVLSCPVAPVGP